MSAWALMWVEEAGERGGEGDGSRRLLRPLVGVGRELVSTLSDGRLLSSIASWELWVEATTVVGLRIELLS